jgi:hypothetical protein
MPNTRQKIILTPSNNSLDGKILPETEHAHILLDSSSGAFSVTLPDAQATMQLELIFKNIGANTVTIRARSGQYIDYDTSHDLAYLNLVSVWPDLLRTWWKLDNNH